MYTGLENKNRGITLIALVITIIVLLILAGVSITMLTGENGILTQTINTKTQYEISEESEAIDLIMTSNKLDETDKYDIGTSLHDKTLENSSLWNIVVINDTQKVYGTGWNYIAKGTSLANYGESKYAWLINYETGEKIKLEEDSYIQLDYKKSVAVTDNLIFNLDPSIILGVTEEELKNNTNNILGENVELYNFDWTEESGLTSTSFNFDGVDDWIEIGFENDDAVNELIQKGLTFEFYGSVEEGASGNPDINGVFGLFQSSTGLDTLLRFGVKEQGIMFGVQTYNTGMNDMSEYSMGSTTGKNVLFPMDILGEDVHYWVFSVDPTNIKTGEYLEEEDRNVEYIKITVFCDGEFVYESWYAKGHWDLIKELYQTQFTRKKLFIGYAGLSDKRQLSKMQVYSMRLYNRTLTTDEIMKNYNTTKTYYSLIN